MLSVAKSWDYFLAAILLRPKMTEAPQVLNVHLSLSVL